MKNFLALPIAPFWAIEPQYASAMAATVDQMGGFQAVVAHMASLAEGGGADDDDLDYELKDGVAHIAFEGPMFARSNCATRWFGGVSSQEMRQLIRKAGRDPAVRAIALHVDSPGGEVSGTDELAQEISRVAKTKPITALVTTACSAALWAISGATEIIATSETAVLGSVGVYAVLRDTSAAAKAAGMKVMVIGTGAHKGTGTPGTEVTEEQQAEVLAEVSALNAVFLKRLADGRGLKLAAGESPADGRVFIGADAVSRGFANRLSTLDEALNDLAKSASNPYTYTYATTAATAQEEPMASQLDEKMLAFFKANPEAAKAANIDPAELETPAQTPAVATAAVDIDPAIKAQLEAQALQLAEMNALAVGQAVASEVSQLIAAGKLTPAEQVSATLLFTQAAQADKATVSIAGLTGGPNLSAVRASYAARPAHSLFTPEIPGSNPDTNPEAASQRKAWLEATDEGAQLIKKDS